MADFSFGHNCLYEWWKSNWSWLDWGVARRRWNTYSCLIFYSNYFNFFHQKDIPQHGVTNIYQNILFKIVKFTLYLSLFIVPVFGWLALSSLTENFQIQSLNISLLSSVKNNYFIADIHELLGNIFITLVGLHACAALIYHFIFKDNVLKSMFLKKK